MCEDGHRQGTAPRQDFQARRILGKGRETQETQKKQESRMDSVSILEENVKTQPYALTEGGVGTNRTNSRKCKP